MLGNRRFRRVGFYTAGFTLLNSYVGIIFTVMSTDYFPRLSSISDDNVSEASVIQQSFISILIITPIVILFLTFITVIVKVIYTLNLFLLYRWFVSVF
jgi:hypothetical protein